jgi:hypothetical protein
MVMHAHVGVKVSGSKQSALIERTSNGRLVVLGATMPVSTPFGEAVDSFAIRRTDEKGLIALQKFGPEPYQAFISVDWSKAKPIELETLWIPQDDRLGQIVNNHIVVLTPSIVYSTKKWASSSYKQLLCYVPDGELLCRFLIGLATEEDVEAAIQERVRQENLAEEVDWLRRDNRKLVDEYQKQLDFGEAERAARSTAERALGERAMQLHAANSAIERVRYELYETGRIGLRGRLRQIVMPK